MQMPHYVETKQDWEEMCAFLESQDKSQRFADMAGDMPEEEKQKFLEKMAEFLRMGVDQYSVGFKNEDEWLIDGFISEVCGVEE